MTAVVLNGAGGANTDPSVWCIDAAGMGSTTNYVPVWERGFRGLSVYNTHHYDLPQRNIEAWWELPDTWIMHNIEGDPYAGLGGAAVGAQYARDGIARMRDRGHQGETAAVFSFVDFGPTASEFPLLDETHQAAVETSQALGQELVGFYLPPVYGRHVALMPWFPANGVLWQWGGGGAPEWWTTVKQAGPSSTPALAHDMSGFGFGADENRLYGPMAGWTGYGGPTPPTGDTVRQFVNNSEPFPAFVNDWGEMQHYGDDPAGTWPAGWLIFEIVPGGKEHVSGAEWNALVPGGGGGIDPAIGRLEQWTTGRIQSMPNVRHAPASPAPPAGARLAGLQIDQVPGRATAVYDA